MDTRAIDAVASALPTAEAMTVGERAALGIETTVTGMVIVFSVLIILSLIVMLVSLMIRGGQSGSKASKDSVQVAPVAPVAVSVPVAENTTVPQSGTKGTGHLVTDGVGSEEEVAVIMAAVAAHSGASLDSLEFKSIKAVD